MARQAEEFMADIRENLVTWCTAGDRVIYQTPVYIYECRPVGRRRPSKAVWSRVPPHSTESVSRASMPYRKLTVGPAWLDEPEQARKRLD